MVLMNIDFYKLREKIRREVTLRIENLETTNYPLDVAWLLYSLSFEDRENNVIFKKGLNSLEKWALSNVSGTRDKELAPLSLCCYLSEKEEVFKKAMKKIKTILENNITKSPLPKFNVLNDPEQIFCISLLKEKMPDKYKTQLIEKIKKNLNGSIIRNIFFSAALYELGEENPIILEKLKSIENPQDVILSLWLVEQYRNKIKSDILRFWKKFESIYPIIAIDELEGGTKLSNRDLVLLYRTVTIEIKEPNPNMLFDLYPIQSEIKEIVQDYVKNKKYSSAVFEATKKPNEMIQNKTGVKNKSEVELIQATMKQIGNPQNLTIQFNEFLTEDSGKNEQAGLAAIAEGIFKAFRNPRGHKPEDHPLLAIDPYEALSQLIIIDYIWKRIESAKINKRGPK